MALQSFACSEVYLLPLNGDGSPNVPGGYIYLPPPSDGYILRFVIEGASSVCRKGSLWVNIPTKEETFKRDRFREFKLHPDFNRNLEISVPIYGAGAFAFYITYSPLPEFSFAAVDSPVPSRTLTYYIDVCPSISLKNSTLPLDAISIISVLSKFVGRYPIDWSGHLQDISQRGYNMIHFAPLMHRGDSNSPYSIYDQLSFDPICFPNGEKDVEDLITRMERDFGLLGLTDVVWNHTANNSKWLEEHPEVGYNILNAPWLESALELDNSILLYSKNLTSLGMPTIIQNQDDLSKIMEGLKKHAIGTIKLWEYYVVHVAASTDATIKAWTRGDISFPKAGFDPLGDNGVRDWTLKEKASFLISNGLQDAGYLRERYDRNIDPKVGAGLLTAIFGRYDKETGYDKKLKARAHFAEILDELNLDFYKEYDSDCAAIVEQVSGRVKYTRLEKNGPNLGEINLKNPLVESYFTRLPLNSTTNKHDPKCLALVNNGWIWNANAMIDHAGSGSRAYLRREVISWGDCVKLNYGRSPSDNPYLWDYMAKYTRLMAKHFVGFRIDNCHSTPLPVAEFLLDEARTIRPNLLVCAELFTGSEETDYVFVKRLGISSLIREAMTAWSTGELSRLVHIHGGRPIGSFEIDERTGMDPSSGSDATKVLGHKEVIRNIKPSPVHALFMDCTHDNETPTQKRIARDTLPNAALVSMCACATGSVIGHDEIYPRLVDLVGETRKYAPPALTGFTGIGQIKKLLNRIHTLMGNDGYDETHIHHEGEYITVHRVHPRTRKGYFLIAHTAFPGNRSENEKLQPVHLAGTKARLLGSWTLEVDDTEAAIKAASGDKTYLKGLPSKILDIEGIIIDIFDQDTKISLPERFPSGSIALFETFIPGVDGSDSLDVFSTSGAKEAFKMVDLIDLNFILYRCDAEERDSSAGKDGVYDVPNHGKLVYAGLQGWWSVLRDIIRENNLGHPLCQHLREGQWALEFIVSRMDRIHRQAGYERLEDPARWLQQRFEAIKGVPSFLLPRYFALVMRTAYNAAWDRGIQLLGPTVQNGQGFLQSLAMVSIQQTGLVNSASLYPTKDVPCLAAGLPHFAVDWARCWGRDVFISLRGLHLATGRYAEAKNHILAFGSVLKHGMIPNLLSSGKLPRYNSRDSVWFFLQAIQEYTTIVPSGLDILKEKVERRFLPYDDTWFSFDDHRAYSKTSSLEDVIQEVLQRHATGISFREYNAGPNLDMQMKPEGFQIDIKVDWATGIIFGGSQYNCGTWQDKMGESQRAGNQGIPGTPRDGAAVEIIGLVYSTLRWVTELNKKGSYKYPGVRLADQNVSFQEWASKIESNFERCFYIPINSSDDKNHDVNPKTVNRRGIYKDLYRSGKEYEDYQLRPNFPIAMAVAPQIFNPDHALQALSIADSILRGPSGMATLDPSDLNYRPNYNNSEDSDDFMTSKGRNYHSGPEWLWPTGFFLRALLKFDLIRRKTKEERTETIQQIALRMKGCKEALIKNPWGGLTELTNKDGAFCSDSSPTQAWSAGCLIDVFHDALELSLS
ncbi:MAG: hypothetical protein M1829_003956 [Trizodia sp. TS-e1964]|nr:MAG: hypothetical protein M1829_003956 [Trizodia sp. TS-e1964]